MKFSLIVPAAADKAEYSDKLPYIFGLDKDGVIFHLIQSECHSKKVIFPL